MNSKDVKRKMNKKVYEVPEWNEILVNREEIIITSDGDNDGPLLTSDNGL